MDAMNAETVSRIIQIIIAPVVMVTSCAILSGGLLSHYGAISDRLRAIARERLDLFRSLGPATDDPLTVERLEQFKTQVPDLVARLRMMRDAVLALYAAIIVFVLDMFVIALSAVTNFDWVASAVLVIFLIGIALLLLSIALTAREIRWSHRAVAYEAQRGLELQDKYVKRKT